MKQILLSSLLFTVIAFPGQAQTVPSPSISENCSNFCIKFDVQSGYPNNIDFNNPSYNPNNIRWQLSLIWRSSSPETIQLEERIAKQQLEDNKAAMAKLAEAISQNNTALANGLSIILAPKLGYKNPQLLISDLQAKFVTVDLSSMQ
jgi:hypothetical protein